MQEYKIKFKNKEYILNNNSSKYDRIFNSKINLEFVKNEQPTNEQILAYYDKFDGLILDKNRKKVANGKFWEIYEKKLAKQSKQEKNWNKKKKIACSFVEFVRGFKEILWLVFLIILLIAVFFGCERAILIIKEIKEPF